MGDSRMTLYLTFGAAAAFVIFVLLLKAGDQESEVSAVGESNYGNRFGPVNGLQPAELAIRIFSQKDREFILRTRSSRLQRLYREERRKVALYWVRRTSRDVSQIMRNHRLRSRQSSNLNVAVEMKLVFLYVQLRFLCGILLVLIQLLGPHVPVNLAARAGELYQRIGRALSEAGAVNRAAPPGSIAAS